VGGCATGLGTAAGPGTSSTYNNKQPRCTTNCSWHSGARYTRLQTALAAALEWASPQAANAE